MFTAFASLTTTIVLLALVVILGLTFMIIDESALSMKDIEDLPEEMHQRKMKNTEMVNKIRGIFGASKKAENKD